VRTGWKHGESDAIMSRIRQR